MPYHIEAESKYPTFFRRRVLVHFLERILLVSFEMSLKFVSDGSINNLANLARSSNSSKLLLTSAGLARPLCQIMAWCRAVNKPLSEAVLAYFTDAYMYHSALLGYSVCKRCHLIWLKFLNAPTCLFYFFIITSPWGLLYTDLVYLR